MKRAYIAAAAVFSSFPLTLFAERADIPTALPIAWQRAKDALAHREITLIDDFESVGILRGQKENPTSNWIVCTGGRGTFVKTVLKVEIEFGRRESGAVVARIEVKGTATWFEDTRVLGNGTPQSGYTLLPCTSTGALERELLDDIVDPVKPIGAP